MAFTYVNAACYRTTAMVSINPIFFIRRSLFWYLHQTRKAKQLFAVSLTAPEQLIHRKSDPLIHFF